MTVSAIVTTTLRGDLRSPEAALRARWNWSWLSPAFGDTKISVSDIDGFVERRGRFLFLETKSTLEGMPLGQRLALTALARQPRTTVLIVIGERNRPREIVTLPGWHREAVTPAQFVARIRTWYRWASRQECEK